MSCCSTILALLIGFVLIAFAMITLAVEWLLGLVMAIFGC